MVVLSNRTPYAASNGRRRLIWETRNAYLCIRVALGKGAGSRGGRRGVTRITMNGGASAYCAHAASSNGTAWRNSRAFVLMPLCLDKPYLLIMLFLSPSPGIKSDASKVSITFCTTVRDFPSTVTKVVFHAGTFFKTPCEPSPFGGTKPADVDKRLRV